jgi:hypothetical protein
MNDFAEMFGDWDVGNKMSAAVDNSSTWTRFESLLHQLTA